MPGNSTVGMFEECADQLNDFIVTLEGYPHTVLAHALRAHLAGLLQALVAHGQWSRADAETFIEELEEETLRG